MSMLPLIGGKMKIASSVGIAGVSIISVPTTLSITSLKGSQEFFQPLTEAVETIKNQSSSHFNGFDSNLKNSYVEFGTQVIDNTKQGLIQLGTKSDEIRQSGETSVSAVNQQKEDINYYAFQLGYLIKAAIRSIPTIIKDSILDAASGGGANQHLLSAQKIYAIIASDKFSEFVGALSNVVTQYADVMSKMTNADTSGIIQIFKELQKEKIETFLGEVKTNSNNLENSTAYCNAAKLMMHVLIGKTKIEGMKQQITELTNLLKSMSSELTSITKGANIDLGQLETQLQTLSNSPQIKDPCNGGK